MVKYIIGALIVIVIALGAFYKQPQSEVALGSIGSNDAYLSTTTDSTWNTPAATLGGFKLVRSGAGILGSVIITNSTAGSFNIYDATTTVNGGVYGTTTLARIAASVAAGTYTFDTAFSKGLLIEFQSTNVASSTITFK